MKGDNFLKENNARFMWHPMTSPEDSQTTPPKIITESSGVQIEDIDGRRVVDAVGGLWNVNLGYSCQPIKDAITAQLAKMPYYSTFRGTANNSALVSNRETKQPVDASVTAVLQEAVYDAGAMIRISAPNLILSPPLVLNDADCTTPFEGVGRRL